jgi:hypothetical protein
MVRFDVEDVWEGTDWKRVTVIPDELEIRLVTSDGERGGSYSDLTDWYVPYQHVRLREPIQGRYRGPEIEELSEGIQVHNGRVSETTTYPQLQAAFEDVLAEVFRQLDELSTPEERQEGLNNLARLTPDNADEGPHELYDRLSARYRDG